MQPPASILSPADLDELETLRVEIKAAHPRAAKVLGSLIREHLARPDALWTTTQVARYLHVSAQTVRNRVDSGFYPSVRTHPRGHRKIPASRFAPIAEFHAQRELAQRRVGPMTDEEILRILNEDKAERRRAANATPDRGARLVGADRGGAGS